MLLTEKVSVDLNRRNVSWARLAWNKLTPTRWAKTVSGTIANMSVNGPVAVAVKADHLAVRTGQAEVPIFRSEAYADALFRAGVIEIEIGAGTAGAKVKTILDHFADSSISAVLRHELVSPDSVAKAILKMTARTTKVIDQQESGHWEEYQGESAYGRFTPGTSGGTSYVIDVLEESHLEFSSRDINRAWSFIKKRDQQFRTAVIDEVAKNDPELAILLARIMLDAHKMLELALNPGLHPRIVIPLIARYVPKSVPAEIEPAKYEQKMTDPGSEGVTSNRSQPPYSDYKEGGSDPVYEDVMVEPEKVITPARYNVDDYRLAANIINHHPLENRTTLLWGVAKLNLGLAEGMKPFIVLK